MVNLYWGEGLPGDELPGTHDINGDAETTLACTRPYFRRTKSAGSSASR